MLEELEHLKIETRLIDEMFASVMVSTVLEVVYYESIKRELKIRGIYECRCDERLQTKTKKFTRLPYTVLCLELSSDHTDKGKLFFRTHKRRS